MAQSPLSAAALRLRNATPEMFENFVRELTAHVDLVTVAVTDADSGNILRLQGHAQEARALLRVFKECHLTAQTKQPAT